MSGAMDPGIAVAVTLGGFVLAGIATLVKGTYAIATSEKKLGDRISEESKVIADRISKESRNTGESNAALRQKIVEVELHMRDFFVRRDEFKGAVDQINSSVNNIRTYIEGRDKSMEERFEKHRGDINAKLDKLLERKA